MTAPIVLGSQTKFVASADAIPKQLFVEVQNLAPAYTLQHDSVDYIVPVTKVFWIYRMIIGCRYQAGTVPAWNVYYGPTPASTAGATKFCGIASGEAQIQRTMPLNMEFIKKITAGNYINIENPYGAHLWINVFGVECDL